MAACVDRYVCADLIGVDFIYFHNVNRSFLETSTFAVSTTCGSKFHSTKFL